MFKFCLFLTLMFACVMSRAQSSQTGPGTYTQQGMAPQDVLAIWPAMSATGNTANASVIGVPLKPAGTNPGIVYLYTPKFSTVQAFVAGSPSVCTYHVYGTLKTPADSPAFPADYQDLSGALDCTTTAGSLVHIYYKPVAGIVIQLSALSGGTSPTVAFRYLAVH